MFLADQPEQTFLNLRIKMFVVGNHDIFLGGKEDVRPNVRWGAGGQPVHFIEYPSYSLHCVPRIVRIKVM